MTSKQMGGNYKKIASFRPFEVKEHITKNC